MVEGLGLLICATAEGAGRQVALRQFAPPTSTASRIVCAAATSQVRVHCGGNISFYVTYADIFPDRLMTPALPIDAKGLSSKLLFPKINCQQGARQPADIIFYRPATSSRNQWPTSSGILR